ncbi:MAG: S-layer homology domain-containing protein [Candidatus Margulisiibacteriota bacterium]
MLLLAVCLAARAEDVTITSDITRLGVGARPLGMGKTFTGMWDDLSTMYVNPGGVGTIKDLQVLSMSSTFANAVEYLTLATAVPTPYGVFGAGFSGSGLGFDTPVFNLVEIATGEYRIIPSTNETVSYDYNSSVVALTYGNQFWRPELTVGTTLKFFGEKIGGSTSANANGFDLDLGLLYRHDPSWAFGLAGKNVLTKEMGGVIRWSSGKSEILPINYLVGFDHQRQLGRFGLLNAALDYEYKPELTSAPGFWHVGLEWWPIETFALRGGVDQDVVGRGDGLSLNATNNLTAGMSLNFSGVRFDYAFHQYNHLAANDTHYFSLAYLHPTPRDYPIDLGQPQDKSVIDRPSVTFRGKTRNPAVSVIKVNNRVALLSTRERTFEAEVPLELGKNSIWLASYDKKGKLLEKRRIRVLRLTSFNDVPDDHWAKLPIEELATLDLISGFPDGTYRPNETLKRAHFLVKVMQLGNIATAEPAPMPFSDIRVRQPVAPFVKSGYNRRLVLGYPDQTFRPSSTTSLVEAILVTVRYSNLPTAEVLERPYDDISGRHWAIKEITAAKQNKFLDFAGAKLDPKQDFTRASFAAIIAKSPPVAARIKGLLDFESGYPASFPY